MGEHLQKIADELKARIESLSDQIESARDRGIAHFKLSNELDQAHRELEAIENWLRLKAN